MLPMSLALLVAPILALPIDSGTTSALAEDHEQGLLSATDALAPSSTVGVSVRHWNGATSSGSCSPSATTCLQNKGSGCDRGRCEVSSDGLQLRAWYHDCAGHCSDMAGSWVSSAGQT